MTYENKSTAHAVSGSMSGRMEQVCNGLVSVSSIPETVRPVKGREGFDDRKARRLAAMLPEGQRRDVLRLAMAIMSSMGT